MVPRQSLELRRVIDKLALGSVNKSFTEASTGAIAVRPHAFFYHAQGGRHQGMGGWLLSEAAKIHSCAADLFCASRTLLNDDEEGVPKTK